MKGRPLVIRADANAKIGLGHVARCLALAEPWRKTGSEVVLLTAEPSAATRERAAGAGVLVRVSQANAGTVEDAHETARVAQMLKASVVLDGYHFHAETQRIVKESGAALLVFDDGGDSEHYYADFVLNQNFGAAEESYVNREPYTKLLLGPRFAQVRGEFLKLRGARREMPRRARNLLVTMGGSDPGNMTARILRSLPAKEATVVVGPENLHEAELRSEFPEARLLRNPENLAELMAEADLAITAGGATAWELAFLGTPMLVTAIAENQKRNVEDVHAAGVGRRFAVEEVGLEVERLAADVEARREMARRQREVFDGLGSVRVWLRMNERNLILREARAPDTELIWQWANDPLVRQVSFNSEPIPWEKHLEWFKEKVGNTNCRVWIAEVEGKAFGQIRFDLSGDEAMLSVSLGAEWRGQNLGTLLVWAGSRKLFAETTVEKVHAFVRPDNGASARMFEKADFDTLGEAKVKEQQALHFVFSRERVEL